jgi:putative transcriptional regulator
MDSRQHIEIVAARITKNTIKKALKDMNLAQEEAARRVGVSSRHFNRIVLGKAEPTLLLATKMAKVLNTTIDVLFPVELKWQPRRNPRSAFDVVPPVT